MGNEVLIFNLHILSAFAAILALVAYRLIKWASKEKRKKAIPMFIAVCFAAFLGIVWIGLYSDRPEVESLKIWTWPVSVLAILIITWGSTELSMQVKPIKAFKVKSRWKLRWSGATKEYNSVAIITALVSGTVSIIVFVFFQYKLRGWLWLISYRDPAKYVTADGQVRDQVGNSTVWAQYGWWLYLATFIFLLSIVWSVIQLLKKKRGRMPMKLKLRLSPVAVAVILVVVLVPTLAGVHVANLYSAYFRDALGLAYKISEVDPSNWLAFDWSSLQIPDLSELGNISINTPTPAGIAEDILQERWSEYINSYQEVYGQ